MVRISSTGEIIQDEPNPSRNRSASGGARISGLGAGSGSQPNRPPNSRSPFGTIDSIRTDNVSTISGYGGQAASGGSNSSSQGARPVFGGHDRNGDGNGQRGGGMGDVFSAMNQKLVQIGVPRIPIGPVIVEPIVLAGLTLSYVFLGARGLIFGGFLFGVHQYANLRN